MPFPKNEALLLPFSTDCSKVLISHPEKMIYQRSDAVYFEVKSMGLCVTAEHAEELQGFEDKVSYECSAGTERVCV